MTLLIKNRICCAYLNTRTSIKQKEKFTILNRLLNRILKDIRNKKNIRITINKPGEPNYFLSNTVFRFANNTHYFLAKILILFSCYIWGRLFLEWFRIRLIPVILEQGLGHTKKICTVSFYVDETCIRVL